MKTTVSILAALVLMVVAVAGAQTPDQAGALTGEQYQRAEQTLLQGIQEDNLGVKEGSTYMLGELSLRKQ